MMYKNFIGKGGMIMVNLNIDEGLFIIDEG